MIGRLQVKSFRSIIHADIEPARVNLFVGPTGAGKTSLKAALEYAITRRNQWTDGRGSGIGAQVRHGQKKGSVRLELDKFTIEAEVPPESGYTKTQAQVFSALGVTEETVRACIADHNFMDLSDTEQKDLLCHVLGVDVSDSRLLGELNRWTPEIPDLGGWFDERLPEAVLSVNYEDYARKQRTGAKRAHKETQERLIAHQGRMWPQPQPQPAKLKELREKRDDVIGQVARLNSEVRSAEQLHGAAVREWEGKRRAREEVEAEFAAAAEAVKQAEAALAQLSGESSGRNVDTVKGELSTLGTQMVELQRRRDELMPQLQPKLEGACAPGECLALRVAEVSKQLQDVNAQLDALVEKQRALDVERDAAEGYARRVDDVNRRKREADERLAKATQKAETTPLSGEHPEEPAVDTGGKDEEFATQLRNIDLEIAPLEQAVSDLRAWQQLSSDIEATERTLSARADEVQRWEALVAALAPTGIRARLLTDPLREFAGVVDTQLRNHFGFGFRVETHPWAVQVEKDGAWLPQAFLSGGERVIVSAVVQVEIARRSGFPLVVLDEVQRLDAARRPALVGYLVQQSDVQSWAFSAAQERDASGHLVRPSDPGIDGVRVFWVADGFVEPAVVAVGVT